LESICVFVTEALARFLYQFRLSNVSTSWKDLAV